jgi:hypothetical protein
MFSWQWSKSSDVFVVYSLASQNNYRIDTNQELLAIGKTPSYPDPWTPSVPGASVSC